LSDREDTKASRAAFGSKGVKWVSKKGLKGMGSMQARSKKKNWPGTGEKTFKKGKKRGPESTRREKQKRRRRG